MRLSEKQLLWGGLGGATALLLIFRGKEAAQGVVDMTTRGKKVSSGFFVEELGIDTMPPEQLLEQVRRNMGDPTITMDELSMARMIRSEGSAQGEIRGHVALNDLKTFKYADSVYGLLTYSTDPDRRGYFGRQYSPANKEAGFPKANKRRFATTRDPYEVDIRVARKVIADRKRGIDKAKGATKFLDKSSMGGVQKGTRSFEEVDKEWRESGYKPFQLAELGSDIVLYRKA